MSGRVISITRTVCDAEMSTSFAYNSQSPAPDARYGRSQQDEEPARFPVVGGEHLLKRVEPGVDRVEPGVHLAGQRVEPGVNRVEPSVEIGAQHPELRSHIGIHALRLSFRSLERACATLLPSSPLTGHDTSS